MLVKKVLIGILIALTALFLGLQTAELELEAAAVRATMCLLLTLLFYIRVPSKNLYFFSFLITFTIGEMFNLAGWISTPEVVDGIDYMYYIANILYIIAYLFLIIKILNDMSLLEMAKKYPIHLLILTILDVFCVMVVTNTSIPKITNASYNLEFVYNSIIMILLTVSVINYIHKDDKKSVILLMGTIFIFFSEVIQTAYFYIAKISILNVFCSVFLVLGFTFFYLQSRLDYEPEEYKLFNDSAA